MWGSVWLSDSCLMGVCRGDEVGGLVLEVVFVIVCSFLLLLLSLQGVLLGLCVCFFIFFWFLLCVCRWFWGSVGMCVSCCMGLCVGV